jgi:hypothetical protein
MTFTAKGRKYEIDRFGVITQTDHRPFTYNPEYSAIYDKEQYKRGSDILQAMRYGFACAAHGKPIKSLMDVGYGNAAFINFIKSHVPYVYGHDITGVPLDGAYLMPEFVKADVYCFWDVLEHFPDCSFLNELPCETICISLPYCHFHTEGLEWFENYHHFKPDEHIRHFNPWSLTAFMNQYGWKAVAESDHEDYVRKGKVVTSIETKIGTIYSTATTESKLQNILSMSFKR